jgi:hypothetical protein
MERAAEAVGQWDSGTVGEEGPDGARIGWAIETWRRTGIDITRPSGEEVVEVMLPVSESQQETPALPSPLRIMTKTLTVIK